MKLLNTALLANPFNWLEVWLMVAIAAVAITALSGEFDNGAS